MKLKDLLEGIEYTCLNGDLNVEISDIIYDSRKVTINSLFVCITGTTTDSHDFIHEAVSKGAVALLTEKDIEIKEGIVVIRVENTRKAMAHMSSIYFEHPSRSLKMIGITGTNGKTTTAYMVREILKNMGHKVGLIGTIEVIIGDTRFPSDNTTPESYILHKYLKDMLDAGCDSVVMEVSSQGLMMHRVGGIVFDYGIFTNIEPDHIGTNEHKDFEDYMMCKGMLFKQCKIGIVNVDSPNYKEVLDGHTCTIETFGLSEEAELRATDIRLLNERSSLGIEYSVKGLMEFDVKLHMPGKFNVYNSLAAIAICRHFNLDIYDIKLALEKVKVKGRIEIIPVTDNSVFMMDYAHNATSLESLLTTLREYNPKRLVCLFGCGGNRSKLRRYEMGEVSGKLADLTIITSDNPRFEEPQDIINDIKTGISKTNGNYVEICDRREAIKYSIDNTIEGDFIVIAGKGHEDYQEIKGVKYPMDERVVINNIINKKSRMQLAVNEITRATRGELVSGTNLSVSSVSTNSKEIEEGALFVALTGEKTDGHKYIDQAFDKGAVAVLISSELDEYRNNKAYIKVNNTLDALQALGKYYRGKFNIPVIGITGSVGKTTAKEMIAKALGVKYNVLKTIGNMNSQVGLPLMMFQLAKEHEIAVFEMGMSEKGEMERLVKISVPNTAVITNIGVSHIGQLGSKENIMIEKLNIINEFDENGIIFANGDDKLLSSSDKITSNNSILCGMGDNCEYRAENIRTNNEQTHFTLVYPDGNEEIVLNVLGTHNVYNAITAIAVANSFDISPKDSKVALAEYKPIEMRGKIIKLKDIKIIDDTYNASPDSVKGGINILKDLPDTKRRIVVLADILELGDMSFQCHYDIGIYILESNVDEVITVGNESKAIIEAINSVNSKIMAKSFNNNLEVIDYLKSIIKAGDGILVKGSRGMHMEEIVEYIERNYL